jgi:hypothetical protein
MALPHPISRYFGIRSLLARVTAQFAPMACGFGTEAPLPQSPVAAALPPAEIEALDDVPECHGAFSAFWDAVRALDAEAAAALFAPRAEFYFGNAPPAIGPEAVRRTLVRLFAETSQVDCRPVMVWSYESVVVAEADLSLEFDDGRSMTIPSTTVLWSGDQGIRQCRVLFSSEPALESIEARAASAAAR